MLIQAKKMIYHNGIDCILENDIELHTKDWNGKVYIKCYKDKKEVNNTYEPIVDINGSKITLIGFKEKKDED